MQQFEPDQLVLVKDPKVRLWALRRYSMPVFGALHGTQDGKLWNDDDILPYEGNECLLGDHVETPEQIIKRLEMEKAEIQRHAEEVQIFLDNLQGKKNENDSRGVWGFIAPLLCSFRR